MNFVNMSFVNMKSANMKSVRTGPVGIFTLGLALVAGTAAAQAQSAVTRQITSEPVETVVTEGPNGTAVTRRILTPEPGFTTYAPPPFEYPPVAAEALTPEYVEPAAPALAPRRVTETRVTTASPATPARARTVTSSATTRRVAARPAHTETRTVTAPARAITRTARVTPPSEPALVLNPAQRQLIYRSVVQREAYPAPVPAGPPVVAQTDVYAPPPASSYYPARTFYPTDDPYYGSSGYSPYRDYAYGPDRYRDYAYGPDRYRDYAYGPDPYRDYRDPYHTGYRQEVIPLVVGARIPPSVPLVAVPDPIVARIPATRDYSYAVIDNRVFLVDPATSLIVAEITP
jgi:hypothetical protein